MQTVVGPVIVTREGGFGFDLWAPEEGLSRGFSYRHIEDAYYARKFEISRTKDPAGAIMACSNARRIRFGRWRNRRFHFGLWARAAPFT